jgi:hypothetical protein
MRHSLYRYFTERKWADESLDGKMRFRSLAYFRDHENESEAEAVRKDDKEGNLVFVPPERLLVSNQTRATTGACDLYLPRQAFKEVHQARLRLKSTQNWPAVSTAHRHVLKCVPRR